MEGVCKIYEEHLKRKVFLFLSPSLNSRGSCSLIGWPMRVRIVMKPFLRENPHQPAITYDISQLFDYIDTLTDLSVLVFDKENAGYSPYNKDWIKVIHFPGKIMVSEFPAIKSILGKNLRYAPPPSKRLKLYKQHLICHCGKTLNKKKPGQIFHLTTTGLPENY